MDKLLEFIVAYIKDIFKTTDKNNKINRKQLSLSLLLLLFLSFISILGYIDGGNNEVLKDYSIFSFYTSIIMIIMFIIGFGGYKKGEEDDNIKKFSDKVDIIKNLISYEKKYKNLLVLSKVNNIYEFNLWLDEKDKDFGQLYIFFPRYETNKFRDKILNLKGSPFILNNDFSDDSLVYEYGFEDGDLDDKGEKLIKKINDVQKIIDENLD